MKLAKLLEGVEYQLVKGDLEKEISEVAYNTKNVVKDALFIAIIGTTADSLLALRWRAGVTFCFLISLGVCRKSWTNSSQSNMRNTRRLLRTTGKQEESFVDLQKKKAEKKVRTRGHIAVK